MMILGVDIGGSGIKGAIVDTDTGLIVGERHRIATPQPATPEAMADSLKALVAHFAWQGPIGCGFPATIHHGVVFTAANIDASWVNVDAQSLFSQACGSSCYLLNDADAAGLAEMRFGVGQGKDGVVMLITIGTGLGSAIFVNGQLHPNTELGHLKIKGRIAEHYCSDAVRQREDLGWKKWGRRFSRYLQRLEFLFNPDLIILGGGASQKLANFQDQLYTRAPVVAAQSLNQAGIIGAALYAQEQVAAQSQA
ncbi:MAG: ROK family protein [Aeromonadaceae bacterium]|nr:ROK family protein [Aeromonadaceae bacterium]